MKYRGDLRVYNTLQTLGIPFDYHEHPPASTVGEALKYWTHIEAAHCKNIFLRNHKGNQHYLLIIHYLHTLNIHQMEQRLRQGKLSFASPTRLKALLGLDPGAVSPFGLINDRENHTHLFIDNYLRGTERISFHPNDNTATLVIPTKGFIKFLDWVGNTYEFLELHDMEHSAFGSPK